MGPAIAFVVLGLFSIVMTAGYYDVTRHDYLLNKDGWQCVATFKDTGDCAAYASKRLVDAAKANQGPTT